MKGENEQSFISKVKTEDWDKIKFLLEEALELPMNERALFLDRSCAADEQHLRGEIESLLDCEAAADKFLQLPAAVFSEGLFAAEMTAPDLLHGQMIGHYRIVRELGRGGMGAVYLAERDQADFVQRVAVKLLRRELNTHDLRVRFARERRILAALEHSRITRLLDIGTTDDGVPFFVMEYVEGLPVNEFCQNLPLAVTLKIFQQICETVAFAHRNLIVHRDLKPSNILIATDGTPKLLDFGISKLLAPEFSSDDGDAATTTQTITNLNAMTPEYAAPEQLRGENVTTAADVYSLGVILYELLTGARPFAFESEDWTKMLQLVADTNPPRPSDAATQSNFVRAARNTRRNPKFKIQNPKSLRGDLDNIVLTALRKEPARRYLSVEKFAEDIERHLRGLPVRARPNTLGYRAGKFARRNRVGVTAAVLLGLSLGGGAITTIWQARVAQTEKAKAENVKAFLEETLKYSDPLRDAPDKNNGETTITDVLNYAADRLENKEFNDQPEVKAELEKIIADGYYGQGKQNLHERHLKNYVALQQSLHRENDPRTIVATATYAGILFAADQNLVESETIFRQVLPKLRREYQNGNVSAAELAEALDVFGYLRRTQGDSREAEAAFREVLALSAEIPAEKRFPTVGITRSTLASTLADQGRFDEALETSRGAVEEYQQAKRVQTADFGFVSIIYGGFLVDRQDYRRADDVLQTAENILRERQSQSSLWLGDCLRNQAISFYEQGRYPEAAAKINEAQRIYLQSFGPAYDHYPTILIYQGLILTKTGKLVEAEKMLREAVKMRVESLPAGHFWIALANGALGECLAAQRRFDKAEPLLRESYDNLRRSQGDANPRTLLARRRLTELYQKM